MYENLSRKLEDVTRKPIPFPLDGEFAVFLNTDRRNHPSIVKVTTIVVKGVDSSAEYM